MRSIGVWILGVTGAGILALLSALVPLAASWSSDLSEIKGDLKAFTGRVDIQRQRIEALVEGQGKIETRLGVLESERRR